MKSQYSPLIIFIFFILTIGLACSIFASDPTPTATTSVSSPTIMPPTETTQPTLTPEPTKTEITTPTESVDESETTEPTDSPETNSSQIASPPREGECANPLYPMFLDNNWVYEVVSPEETSQIGMTVTEVNGNKATLNALYLSTGITTESTVECEKGAITNFPIALLGFLFGDVDGNLQLEHVDGVFAPSYETFVENAWNMTWEGNYIASGTIEATIEGELIKGVLQESPLMMKWETVEGKEDLFDPIDVKAGSYPQAIKVAREISLDFTAELEESGQVTPLAAKIILKQLLWYEPNLGLLKQIIDSGDIQVYGITFPLVVDSTIELLEFRSGE